MVSVSLTLAGCARQLEVTPESRLAAAVQTLAAETEAFKARRRATVKVRTAALGDEQAETALLARDVTQVKTVWKLTKDAERAELFEQIIAASQAAGDAWVAHRALLEQQAEAVDAADTKLALSTEALGRIVQALNAIASPESLEDQVRFYVAFAAETKTAVEVRLKASSDAETKESEAKREALKQSLKSVPKLKEIR